MKCTVCGKETPSKTKNLPCCVSCRPELKRMKNKFNGEHKTSVSRGGTINHLKYPKWRLAKKYGFDYFKFLEDYIEMAEKNSPEGSKNGGK